MGNKRILFVDDNEELLDALTPVLERYGYQVTALTSSSQALKTFERNPKDFDLLLTDQVMPEITGLDLARKIRDVRRNIPVILISGYVETVTSEEIKTAGVQVLLQKPVTGQDLDTIIRDVMKKRS